MKRIILMLLLGVLPVAVNADSLESWGRDDYNQVTDTPADTDFIAVAGGWYHSLALKADGSIESWGDDGFDQVTDSPAGTDFAAVAGGYYHSLALKADGSIESWGYDAYDQVTDTPIGINFVGIAAGGHHSLALKAIPAVVVIQGIAGSTLHPHHDGSGSLNDLVRVKVFGSMTSVGDPVDLDTADIDLATVRFGPGLAAQASGKAVFNGDYDSDGIQDKKFRFRMGDVAFDKVTCTDSSGTLTGNLTTGEAFEGSDSFTSNCVAGCH